jgi:thiol-disulfide isomerase/thioredoxin
MRRLVAVLLTAIILLPIQAAATANSLWDEARVFDERGTSGGTIGGISIDINNNTTDELIISQVASLPSIVEVYTATWCLNCVKTEQALDEAIESLPNLAKEITRIHYHRYLYETLDPFGSNSTDSRWVDTYGKGSLISSEISFEASDGRTVQIDGTERSAPSKVFDGERMYTGTSTKSNSLQTDYGTALTMGPSHPFSSINHLELAVLHDTTKPELLSFHWNISLSAEVENWEVTSWLMFVEHSAYFPEGSNGKGNYSHVLHEAVNIGSQNESSILLDPPEPWDGDDMSVILLVDWTTRSPSTGDNSLPAPALSTLLCMLAALVPRRNRDSEPLQ